MYQGTYRLAGAGPFPLSLLFLCFLFFQGAALLPGQSRAIELYREAEEAEERGNMELATELYKASLRENPRYRDPYLRLADLQFRSDAVEEALIYAETALRMDRTNSTITILRARILTSLGRFDEAGETLQQLLEREPYNTDLFRALGELEIARGSLRGALLWYERALSVDPDNRRAILSSVAVQDALDMEELSEEMLIKAVELYPESYDVHMTAARHYLERSMLEKAAYHTDIAMRIAPESREALLLHADLLARGGNYSELLERLGQNPRSIILPDDHLSFYLQGAAHAETGNIERALQAFETVLRIKPEDEISRIAYEDILSGLVDDLRKRYRASIEDAAGYHIRRAETLLDRNRLQESMEHVRRALRIDPDHFTARSLYARLWLLKGFPDKQLSILELLSGNEEGGTEIADLIEIYRHELSSSISRQWEIDQFSHERFRYRIPVYISGIESSMLHGLSNDALARFCSHNLHGSEHLLVPDSGEVDSFAEAYGRARNGDAHYFAILSFIEDDRSFTLTSELYSGETGALIQKEQFYRTGNERLANAIGIWAERLASSLPALGRVVQYSFSSALIDLGRIDGIGADDELLIIPREKLSLSRSSLSVLYDPEYKAGTIRISETDELVSQGTVTASGFYDLVSPGDWVLAAKEEADEDIEKKDPALFFPDNGPQYSEMYRSLVKLR